MTGPMSHGVNGLRAGDVDRENKEPTIEGLKLGRDSTEKNERDEVFIAKR